MYEGRVVVKPLGDYVLTMYWTVGFPIISL